MATHRLMPVLFSSGLLCFVVVGCSTLNASPVLASPAGSAAASTAASAAASSSPAVGMTIYHEDNPQVEVIAPSRHRILIDVWDPTFCRSPSRQMTFS